MLLGTEVGLGPGYIVLDGDPASPEGAQTPNFRPVSIVAKRWPISATAELLGLVNNAFLNVWLPRAPRDRLGQSSSQRCRCIVVDELTP